MINRLTAFLGDENFLALPWPEQPAPYLKLESLNPAGSIKFKTALGLIEDCEAKGVLANGKRLIESSSGNLGVAVSMICAARGYDFTCVVDPNTSRQNIRRMKVFGASIVEVTTPDANGGFLGSRIDHIRLLIDRDPRYHWINQYANEANPRIHRDTTGLSIDRSFDKLDYVFIGAGTTGTLMGCVARLSRRRPAPRIVAVDSVGSVTLGSPPGPRHIPGLGASRQPPLFDPAGLYAIALVPESVAIANCRYLARRQGILAGGSTGSVLAAIRAFQASFSPDDVVVAIAPDGGEPYLDTIYDDDWVQDRFGSDALIPSLGPPDAGQVVVRQFGPKKISEVCHD
ncbi:2,3-diaminopropionate biosynthesis protein SbnA [Stappia sp. ES.058]|uniref:2,3-diaminopropionate biosynthesis protein SbnA n=1 Tax=Stappia sp. ES.058 TaxID=1881061 RepID=UPI00087B1787|nr:2,3-diaminopropionate biosynthesis protein SbnA [Stappia sp. ES.058]SDU18573.1 cysteine synthase A [Stappia sp. ES.058]